MVGDRVAQVLMNSGDFNHGMTYSGHPVAAAVAAANLKILRDEGIVDRVRDDTGPYLQKKWQDAFADHPHLDDVRGVGFLAAFTWVKDKSRRELFANPGEVGTICRDIFFKNNLIMRAVGDSMVSAPPLVMTQTEIDEMIALAARCVDQTTNTLRARGLI
jgi:putrescine aminotransferase